MVGTIVHSVHNSASIMKIVACVALLLKVLVSEVAAQPRYLANYKAQFQYLLGSDCRGPSPVLHVACQGEIVVERNTLDLLTNCAANVQQDARGWNFIECTSTYCQDEGCVDKWRVVDREPSDSYGEIIFECSGSSIDDVDAYMSYEPVGRGTCDADAAVGQANVHVARLGVLCDNTFDFDDYYFECGSKVSPFTPNDGFADSQACADGFICDPSLGCENFDFDRIEVRADHAHFQTTCVEASEGSVIPGPQPKPAIDDGRVRKTAFRSTWAILTDDTQSLCTGSKQNIRLECKDGIIEFISYDGSTTADCVPKGDNILDCNDTGTSDFSGAIFTCIGFGRPAEVVSTYLEADVTCRNRNNVTVYHALQLGIRCRNGYSISDEFVECGSESHVYDELDRQGNDGTRWTCAKGALIPASFPSNSSRVITDVSIRTDQFWLSDAPTQCYDVVEGITRPPMQAPTSMPANNEATQSPTERPTAPPSKNDSLLAKQEESSGPNVGPVVGGVLGGLMAVLILLALMVLAAKKQRALTLRTEKANDITYAVDRDDKELELSVIDGSKTID